MPQGGRIYTAVEVPIFIPFYLFFCFFDSSSFLVVSALRESSRCRTSHSQMFDIPPDVSVQHAGR